MKRWRLLGLCILVLTFLSAGCMPPADLTGAACKTDEDCSPDGFKALSCINGICGDREKNEETTPDETSDSDRKPDLWPDLRPDDGGREKKPDNPDLRPVPMLTKIEGDGTTGEIVYNKTQKPPSAVEASKRFQKSWFFEGRNLSLLTGVKLVLDKDKNKVFNMKLDKGSDTMRRLTLPKNLIAGLFLIVGLMGTQEIALGQVFVLQGEKGEQGKAGEKGEKGTTGKDGLGFSQENITFLNDLKSSGVTANYLKNLQNFLKIDSSKKRLTVTGANLQITNGSNQTNSTNGVGNLIIGYNSGVTSERGGSHNLVVGDGHKFTSYAGIVSGQNNEIKAVAAVAIGGQYNSVSGDFSSVLGGGKKLQGSGNVVTGEYSVIVGGSENKIQGSTSVISGGSENKIQGSTSVISGGSKNKIQGSTSVISGGSENNIKLSASSSAICASGSVWICSSSSLFSAGKLNETLGKFSGAVDSRCKAP